MAAMAKVVIGMTASNPQNKTNYTQFIVPFWFSNTLLVFSIYCIP